MKALARLLILAVIAVGLATAPADAAVITFNCSIDSHAPGTSCIPGGPFGTLMLDQSVIDPLRVDVSWNLDPATGDAIERVLLNYGPGVPDHSQLRLLAAGSMPGAQGPTLGAALICHDCQTLGQFGFDIRLTPQGLPDTFSGSLALFDILGPVSTQLPLTVADLFPVLTVPTAVNPGQPPLLAGYRTTVAGASIGEFWAGSFQGGPAPPPPVIPEPATLLLLGTGLAGVEGVRRWRGRGRRPSAP